MEKRAFFTVVLAFWLVSEGVECVAQVPRVRSEDPAIAELVARASTHSKTFRELVERIDRTDGLVYIARAQCRHGGSACLDLRVTVAGPNRVLRAFVDPRQADDQQEVMASIGHELWHAIEILEQPSLRDYDAVFHFYAREARHSDRSAFPFGGWETPEARRSGETVLKELRRVDGLRGR